VDKWKRIATALAAATAIAMPAEGLRRVAYHDPVGVLTVCYGTTGNVQRGRVYTEQECRALLDRDMLAAIETVERCVPGLPWQQLAAWSDAVYNLGSRIVCDTETSTAARLLKEGRRDEACLQLPRWNKARVAGRLVELPGLTKRRAREMELCLRGFV
jgi:GH24 family phage-related lysozyme (muramidase)